MNRWIAPVAIAVVAALVTASQFASASQLAVSARNVKVFQFSTRPSVPTVLRLTATEDTWNDDRATTTTHGNDPRLGLADSTQACFVIANTTCTTIRNARSYLKFDLSSIPTGATIQSATLELDGGPTTIGSGTVNARRVTGSWNEATMTYNSRPATSSTGSVTGSTTNVAGTVALSFDVTSLVQSRSTTSIANGWELRPNGADSWWYSSEWATDAQRPTLTVVFQ